MNTIRIDPLAVGSKAREFVERDDIFRVHSLFTHAVNLLGDHCLITISDNRWMMHPHSIISRTPLNDQVWKEAFVRIELQSTGPLMELPGMTVLDNGLFYSVDRIDHNLNNLLLWLRENVIHTSVTMRELSLPLSALGREVLKWRLGRMGTLPAITRLIGRGSGLTPAGDDVLVGMLAFFHAWEKINGNADNSELIGLFKHICQTIAREADGGTNLISGWMLKYAIAGDVLHELQTICVALLNKDVQPDSFQPMHRIGHSSGKDMLIGVYAAGLIISKFGRLDNTRKGESLLG